MNESVLFKVSGMKCGGCETIVNTKLKTLPGVKSSSASSKSAEVQVEFETSSTSRQEIIDAITEAGFTVETN